MDLNVASYLRVVGDVLIVQGDHRGELHVGAAPALTVGAWYARRRWGR